MIERRHFHAGLIATVGSSALAPVTHAMTADLSGGLPVQREYVLDDMPPPDVRDAVNIWVAEENGAFGLRLGIEALSPDWDAHDIWLDIAFPNGRVLTRRGSGKTGPARGPEGLPTVREAGPVRFRCVEPFRLWTASFHGQAAEISAADLIRSPVVEEKVMRDVEIDLSLTMAAPPWVPGSLLPAAGSALKGEQGEFMSPRYEQLFRAVGRMRVGDQNWDFKANGLRIRRQGVRKFKGFWGHCWQSAVFPSGKAFGYCAYPPKADGEPSYNEGYVFDGGGSLKPARAVQIPWMRELRTSGDHVPLVLQTAEGLISIDGTSFANTRSRGGKALTDRFPVVQQAHARYRWEDEETCGMMERSTLAEQLNLTRGARERV
jgi:hypothetical protein